MRDVYGNTMQTVRGFAIQMTMTQNPVPYNYGQKRTFKCPKLGKGVMFPKCKQKTDKNI